MRRGGRFEGNSVAARQGPHRDSDLEQQGAVTASSAWRGAGPSLDWAGKAGPFKVADRLMNPFSRTNGVFSVARLSRSKRKNRRTRAKQREWKGAVQEGSWKEIRDAPVVVRRRPFQAARHHIRAAGPFESRGPRGMGVPTGRAGEADRTHQLPGNAGWIDWAGRRVGWTVGVWRKGEQSGHPWGQLLQGQGSAGGGDQGGGREKPRCEGGRR